MGRAIPIIFVTFLGCRTCGIIDNPFADVKQLRFTSNDMNDLAPRLCQFATEYQWKVLELRIERPTLEDMFVKITEEDDVVAPVRASSGIRAGVGPRLRLSVRVTHCERALSRKRRNGKIHLGEIAMRPTLSMIRREFTAYFYSPIAYIVLTIFLAVTGHLFFLSLDMLTAGPKGISYPMDLYVHNPPFG